MWGDMTRGYLAEYAFILFLKQHWNITAELGHEKGDLQDYLPLDIHKIQKNSESSRDPKIKIGIKRTKMNGIWLDVPGAEFNHSDVHILVKVGTSHDHLFAYFKHISVFKDKILKKGMELGVIDQEETDSLFDNLPLFQSIPAYIAGFVIQNKKYKLLDYSGKKGRLHYNIQSWNGEMKSGDLEKIKVKEKLTQKGKVKFEGIGDFSHENGYLFKLGNYFGRKKTGKNW